MTGSGATTLRVGRERRLFVDDMILETKRNVVRSLHAPVKHPDNPLFVACRPWEDSSVHLYGSVVRDEEDGLFKMWYLAGNRDLDDYANRRLLCYAVSQDGLRWQRPELGLHEFMGCWANNIVYPVISR